MPATPRFTAHLLVPIAAIAALTVLALAGFLWWSAERVDAVEVEREHLLLARALEEQQTQMTLAQTGVAVWDDSVAALARNDVAWLSENLGTYHYDAYGYERAIVVDHARQPVTSVVAGYPVPPGTARPAIAALAPLFARLETPSTQAHLAAFNRGSRDQPPSVIAFTRFEDRPALVSIMPILSFSGDNAPAPGSEGYLVTAMMLDADLAAYLGDQYRIGHVDFLEERRALRDNQASLPIMDIDGQPLAYLVWRPETPGTSLLMSALPAMAAALAIVILIVLLLLRSLDHAWRQLRAEREEASHNALHDPLTGLGNRALFHARLSQNLRDLSRPGPRLALLALDLDRFKQVNDTLGHAAGDELLRQVAGRLAGELRPTDTLVRLGGDEFAIIQPDISSHDQPARLAQVIIGLLSAPIVLRDGVAVIGVSIGIATAPDFATTEDELTRLADDALYRAKNGGRNRYCLHSAPRPGDAAHLDAQLRESFALRRSAG